MNKIRKAMFYSIIFKHLLLMNDTVTLSSIIIITRQSFIQSSNAIAFIFFLLMLNSFLQFLSTPYAHKYHIGEMLGRRGFPVLTDAADTESV